MVTVTFKLSDADPVSLELKQPEPLNSVLTRAAQQAGVELGGFIAVKNDKVIRAGDLVGIEDEIDVFPAISGG